MNLQGSCPPLLDSGDDSKKAVFDASRIPCSGHSLYLSARPGLGDKFTSALASSHIGFLKTVLEEDIRCIVVLLTEEEITRFYGMDLCAHYAKNGIEAVLYPIPEGAVPRDPRTFHAMIQTISDRLSHGNVLVHCSTGLGRTGMVAAGLLVYDGETPETAIALVRRARKGSVETAGQEEFLGTYARDLLGAAAS